MMIKIDFNQFSGELLNSSLQALLHNSVYKKKSMYYSRLLRSQPISPMNNAIYWIVNTLFKMVHDSTMSVIIIGIRYAVIKALRMSQIRVPDKKKIR
ncbi:hypothetical protein TSAR_012148 [Trichomalopsis sarcophagae]|uniref:Uncharacterized protein n=1 Tax=Trichomalopsis sarcophagae TaxID=543379 RepID=A0A232ERF8_9HYME|nr:hypothetical protein TSAR_012148 [Trichomalopsis sarcophagae]